MLAPWDSVFILRRAMSDHLFAYGTLIPGCEPAQMKAVCSRLEPVGAGTVRGILYDLGSFPGVVEGGGMVRGVILRIPPDAWAALDQYEGCRMPGSAHGLFRRTRTSARLCSGEAPKPRMHCRR